MGESRVWRKHKKLCIFVAEYIRHELKRFDGDRLMNQTEEEWNEESKQLYPVSSIICNEKLDSRVKFPDYDKIWVGLKKTGGVNFAYNCEE